ncbi:MAG: organic solvent tolerance protein OstA [Desulfobacterales bacterium]|nr:MAG: organic solvent tolerance protein OstA [Desulfobacterales bacterium]
MICNLLGKRSVYHIFSWKVMSQIGGYTLIFLLCSAGWLLALPPQIEDPKAVSWDISAFMLTYDNERQLYTAQDDVIITGGKTRLEADYIEFNNVTKTAVAKGNVLFFSGEDTITCDAMQINLQTETGTIQNGTIFIQDGNYYITGEQLRKTGEFTYDALKGTITTCDGDAPDWKISGNDIKVTLDGYGTAAHSTLWVKKMPVFYSPYMVFPVKTTRQTGLLFPAIGHSDRKGVEYEQPLYLALSRNVDATIYGHYMTKRGVKAAGEFRYVLSPKSKGMIVADYFKDRKIGDNTIVNETYSYDSTPTRTNTDRYWIRMKLDQDLGYGVTAKLDVDWVSDADYLQEFKNGFTGFNATNNSFRAMFGRNLDGYDDTIRKNSLQINKTWSYCSLSAQAIWYDNIAAKQQSSTMDDMTLQTLPAIEFNASRQQIGTTGLFYTIDSEWRSFYRKETDSVLGNNKKRSELKIRGQRADVLSCLYYPMHLGRFVFFEPYAGVRGTVWHADDFTYTDENGTAQNSDNSAFRGLYEAGAQLSTRLSRTFSIDMDFAKKIKHDIVPRLSYRFIPDTHQDDLPYFDTVDNIEKTNLLNWSLTQTFTAQQINTTATDNKAKTYKELAWFKLSQNYDIKSDRDGKKANQSPWQALRLKYELNPFKFVNSNGDIALNPYTGQLTEVKVGAALKDNRGDSICTAYHYNVKDDITDSPYTFSRNGSKTTVNTHAWLTQINLQPLTSLIVYYSHEENLDTWDTIETKAGFKLQKQCWDLIFEGQDVFSSDRAFKFMVRLHGIGEFGTL